MGKISLRFGEYELEDAVFTLTRGVSAGAGTLTISGRGARELAERLRSASSEPARETLVLSDEVTSVEIPNLCVTQITPPTVENGSAVATVRDVRLLWKFGAISGDYNLSAGDGKTLVSGTEKTWRELAELVWSAMPNPTSATLFFPDESLISVCSENLPLDLRWRKETPVEILQDLLEFAGCVLCYDPISNRADIRKRGVGEPPVLDRVLFAPWEGARWNGAPEQIILVGAPIRNEATLSNWIAVGKDLDGAIKPVNDLSYKPSGAWTDYLDTAQLRLNLERLRQDLPSGISTNAQKESALQLAAATVFRWYRIPQESDAEGNSYLPMLEERASVASIGGADHRDEPLVEALYARKIPGKKTLANTADYHAIKLAYALDLKNGLVKFSRPLLKYSSGTFSAADVRVTFAHEKISCYEYGATAATNVRHLKRPDFILWEIAGVAQNQSELDARALRLVEDLQAEQSSPSKKTSCVGALNVSTSGVVEAVRWECSREGLITTVFVNDGRVKGAVGERERSAAQRLGRAARLAEEMSVSEAEQAGVGCGRRAKSSVGSPALCDDEFGGQDWLYVLNASGYSISAGDVVVGLGDWDSTAQLLRVGRATQDSDPLTLGVALENAANGKAFRVRLSGYAVVRTSGSVSVGDRLGVAANNFYAVTQECGNLGRVVANVDTDRYLVFFSDAGLVWRNFANGTEIDEATPDTAFGQISGRKTSKISSLSGQESRILLPFSADGQTSIPAGRTIEILLQWEKAFSEAGKDAAGSYSNEITLTCGLILVPFNPAAVTWNWWGANGDSEYHTAGFRLKAEQMFEISGSEVEASSVEQSFTSAKMTASSACYGIIIRTTAAQVNSPEYWSGFGALTQSDPSAARYLVY